MKKIVFTVTNGLSFDQRMQKICTSLTSDFEVTLIGRKMGTEVLEKKVYKQILLNCPFKKGIGFYLFYNIQLFLHLLFSKKYDAYCCIDLDTILPVLGVSVLKGSIRVFDAHELFTEQKEIVTRPMIKKIWDWIEAFSVPKFKDGYTVNGFIRETLLRRYGVAYEIVRNVPVYFPLSPAPSYPQKIILYQGAVNEGRCFETLIPAMKYVNAELWICGEGNYFDKAVDLAKKEGLYQTKIVFKGMVLPDKLREITQRCHIGVTLFEAVGLNQIYSLANRFFDYMMGGIPQICVAYPEYKTILEKFPFALMLEGTDTETIAYSLNKIINDDVLYLELRKNTIYAREKINWTEEELTLKHFWKRLLP